MVSKGRLLFTIEPDKYKNNVDYTQADLESKNVCLGESQT